MNWLTSLKQNFIIEGLPEEGFIIFRRGDGFPDTFNTRKNKNRTIPRWIIACYFELISRKNVSMNTPEMLVVSLYRRFLVTWRKEIIN